MRYSLLLPMAVLGGVLLVGCGEQPGPAEPASAPQPSFRTENNPDGPGAQIIRFAFGGIVIADPDRGFFLTIGAPVSDFPECGGPGLITGETGKIVVTPAEIVHVVGGIRQGPMVLYGRFSENGCDLTEADVVARGQGNATLMISTRPSSTLFQIKATGRVELTTGGLAHLLAQGHLVFDPDGNLLSVHVDRFQLKPIGG